MSKCIGRQRTIRKKDVRIKECIAVMMCAGLLSVFGVHENASASEKVGASENAEVSEKVEAGVFREAMQLQ